MMNLLAQKTDRVGILAMGEKSMRQKWPGPASSVGPVSHPVILQQVTTCSRLVEAYDSTIAAEEKEQTTGHVKFEAMAGRGESQPPTSH